MNCSFSTSVNKSIFNNKKWLLFYPDKTKVEYVCQIVVGLRVWLKLRNPLFGCGGFGSDLFIPENIKMKNFKMLVNTDFRPKQNCGGEGTICLSS